MLNHKYTRKEVAMSFDVKPQLVTYISSEFTEYLGFENHKEREHRRYNKEQCKKMGYLIHLYNHENYSIKGIKEFLLENSNSLPFENEITESNELKHNENIEVRTIVRTEIDKYMYDKFSNK